MKLFLNIRSVKYVGLVIALVVFFISIGIFEQTIFEYRQTFECSAEVYMEYNQEMENYSVSLEDSKITFSPNFESIGDSLMSQGVRRFELKVMINKSAYEPFFAQSYFTHFDLENVKCVSLKDFGQSKSMGYSLGLSLLIYVLFTLVGLVLRPTTPAPSKMA